MSVQWLTHPLSFTWSQINPAAHPFDTSAARKLVDEAFARLAPTAPRDLKDLDAQMAHAERCVREIQLALIRHVGSWTEGWLWRDDGGPISAALPYRDHPTKRVVFDADGVMASLVEWRTFLEELAVLFIESGKEASPTRSMALIGGEVEAAARRFFPFVIRYTDADDQWFYTFGAVLRWYLEDRGYSNKDTWERLAIIIERTLDGRFASWTAPEEDTARLACRDLGESVERICNEPNQEPLIDGMAWWMGTRRVTLQDFKPQLQSEHRSLRVDGHREFIRLRDRPRDADRADRMEVALDMCRTWAASDEPLTFDHLASWQAIVLGLDGVKKAEFRKGTAYAKGGREIYPLEGARAAFEEGLADANDTSAPLPVRAARAYLDVCFFHPFTDGNGRAARLVLDALLTREGYGLHNADIFALSQNPGSAHWLALQVDLLMGPQASKAV